MKITAIEITREVIDTGEKDGWTVWEAGKKVSIRIDLNNVDSEKTKKLFNLISAMTNAGSSKTFGGINISKQGIPNEVQRIQFIENLLKVLEEYRE